MLYKPRKYFNQLMSGAPDIRSFLSLLNAWTISWLMLTALITVAYAYFFKDQTTMQAILASFFPFAAWVAVILGILILYIHDKWQKNDPVQRVFPVLIWGRKTLVHMGPLLRQYLFLNDQEETPYNRITRNWVYETSRGVRNTIGFGTQVDMDKVGATIVLPATFTNKKTKRGEETGHKYQKIIGKHTRVEPVTINHFVHISAMSYGALSFNAHAALNLGARKAGIMHNTGEGGLADCHEYGGGDLIFQIGTGKYGIRKDNGEMDDERLREVSQHPQVRMLEIKLAQGAKPGKGGMLLKEKITEEIARIRKVPMGQDIFSPARHEEFNDVDGLFDFIDHVRGIAKKPVGIKMVIGHTAEIESIAAKMQQEPGRGPDYIAIDGGEGGTGASPLVLSSYAGLPMKQAVAVADWALKKHNVRDKVVLFASGKIATPIEIAVAMALGAEAVYIARGFMLSLGCIQALECHTNRCPAGIATQNKRLQRALNVEAAAERVATYAGKLYKETQMLTESCGYDSPDQITPDDIMVVTSPGHLDYLSELQGISAYEASRERRRAREMGMTVGEMKIREDKDELNSNL